MVRYSSRLGRILAIVMIVSLLFACVTSASAEESAQQDSSKKYFLMSSIGMTQNEEFDNFFHRDIIDFTMRDEIDLDEDTSVVLLDINPKFSWHSKRPEVSFLLNDCYDFDSFWWAYTLMSEIDQGEDIYFYYDPAIANADMNGQVVELLKELTSQEQSLRTRLLMLGPPYTTNATKTWTPYIYNVFDELYAYENTGKTNTYEPEKVIEILTDYAKESGFPLYTLEAIAENEYVISGNDASGVLKVIELENVDTNDLESWQYVTYEALRFSGIEN